MLRPAARRPGRCRGLIRLSIRVGLAALLSPTLIVGSAYAGSVAARSASPRLFANDDPPAWVAVRAPRTPAERSVVTQVLSWWDAEAIAWWDPSLDPPVVPDGVALAWWSDAPATALTEAALTDAASLGGAALAWWGDDSAGRPAPANATISANAAVSADAAPVAALAWWGSSAGDAVTPAAFADPAFASSYYGPKSSPQDDFLEGDDAIVADRDVEPTADGDAFADAADDPTGCNQLACLFPPLREIDAGLNSPSPVLASTVRLVPGDDGLCEREVPVAYREIEPPTDLVGPCFAAAGDLNATPYGLRPRTLAMPFCFGHRPLYFEDPNLERCGISCGPCVQPLVSGAHFFGTIPLLPWWAATRPPCELVAATPFCPPGRKYDFADNYLPPLEAEGALAEGAAVAAFFLIFP